MLFLRVIVWCGAEKFSLKKSCFYLYIRRRYVDCRYSPTLKISIASSFGVKEIPWYQKKRTIQYLNRIEYISMRENRGSEIEFVLD